jgi:hypothetical protein
VSEEDSAHVSDWDSGPPTPEEQELALRRRAKAYNYTVSRLEASLRVRVPLISWRVGRFSNDIDFDPSEFHVVAFLRINGHPLTCTYWLSKDIVTDTEIDLVGVVSEAFVSTLGRAILTWKPGCEETPELEK